MSARRAIGIVLTRPVGRARALARGLKARGFDVAAVPGSAIGPPPDRARARSALQSARRADVVIFLSPTAVASAFRLEPKVAIGRHCTVLAPGPGTCAALARRGIAAACPTARHDSEGLLAMPALVGVAGRRVVLVGAPGGRDLLARRLRARGASVEPIHVYVRRPPRLDRRHVAALDALPSTVVSVWSSADAIRHLVSALPSHEIDRLRRSDAVASSERIAALLRAEGFTRIAVADSARPTALIEAIDRLTARHRKATADATKRHRSRPTIR